MTASRVDLTAKLKRVVGPPDDPDISDGRLLARFTADRDDAAFALLVRRHGPMVYGVCRRVLGDHHLTEDAFQAVFLVLARRASEVQPREAVGGFLYGVAYRVALRARTMSGRRGKRETLVAAVPDTPAVADPPLESAEQSTILDSEIARLSETLRTAVVLCELEGRSRADVARHLGIPEGTLSSRLAAARKQLASRLARRGVTATAAGLSVLIERSSFAALPIELVGTTVRLAVGPEGPSGIIAVMMSGELRTMLLKKLRLASVGVLMLVAGVTAILAAPGVFDAAAEDPPSLPVRVGKQKPNVVASPAKPGKILLMRTDDFAVVALDGKVQVTGKHGMAWRGWLSPDGKKVAYVSHAKTEDHPSLYRYRLMVRDAEGIGDPKELDPAVVDGCWSPDGKQFLTVDWPREGDGTWQFHHALIDIDTGEKSSLKLPPRARVLDWSRDGTTFVVEIVNSAGNKPQIGLFSRTEGVLRILTVLKDRYGEVVARLSPDGTKILLIDDDPARKRAHKWVISKRPYLLDVTTGKVEPLPGFPDKGRAMGVAWSPDGKLIAYAWQELHEELLKQDKLAAADAETVTEGFLVIAEADGRNPKTVRTTSGRFGNANSLVVGYVDWR